MGHFHQASVSGFRQGIHKKMDKLCIISILILLLLRMAYVIEAYAEISGVYLLNKPSVLGR